MTYLWRRLISWCCSDSPLYVPHWTPEKARKHERNTLRMLGRGETAYAWSARFRQRKPVLKMPARKVG